MVVGTDHGHGKERSMASELSSERRRGEVDGGEVRRDEDQTIQLREEELHARKQMREAGKVEIRKEVVAEGKTLEVPVAHEEVFVERHAMDRRPSDAPIGDGESIEVPVYEEEVRVEKRPVVYEELEIGRRQIRETERVSDTVRREVVDAKPRGDIDMRGWDEVRGATRQAWEKRFKGSGRRWDDVEPGYHYSHEMVSDPRFRDRDFDQAEPELRADYGEWARRQGHGQDDADDSRWQRLRESVREAWDDARSRR
jgi:uncharacterized protein (TIGR02271 family)